MPKHKHKRKSRDQAIKIGTSHTAGGVGFISPKLADAPCVVNPDSPYAELLKTLPQLEVVQPPN
jgi:hypothetical protein